MRIYIVNEEEIPEGERTWLDHLLGCESQGEYVIEASTEEMVAIMLVIIAITITVVVL